MWKIKQIIKYLISRKLLTEEQYLGAEDYALMKNISIEESLIFLNMLDYETLGRAISKVSGWPYQPLLSTTPSELAKGKVPLKFAERWKVFPVAFSPEENLLSLATSEPENKELKGQLQRFFRESFDLAFTVAAREEIERAISVHYKGEVYRRIEKLKIPKEFTILTSENELGQERALSEQHPLYRNVVLLEPNLTVANGLIKALRNDGVSQTDWASSSRELIGLLRDNNYDLLLVNGRTFPARGAWLQNFPKDVEFPQASYYNLSPLLLGQEHPYDEMSKALISLVSFLVRTRLKHNGEGLRQLLTRVKYCKLLALRLDLPPAQVDGTVLTAWISSQGLWQEMVGHITTPYHLEEIFEKSNLAEDAERIEAIILGLVTEYQKIRKEEPGLSKDMVQLRRRLGQHLSTSRIEPVLETFLNLLKDEAFLEGVDQPLGHILIVDPSSSEMAAMALRLNNDGLEVEMASDAQQAIEKMGSAKIDLIISEINLNETDGIAFCQTVKGNPSTSHISFLFLSSMEAEGLAAECFGAGADDYLKKPIDQELLSLKIQRLISPKGPKEPQGGINGSLADMNASDFIQNLSAGYKNVEITIESPGARGLIHIKNGVIIHAATDSKVGVEAFCRIVAWEEGDFHIASCSEFPDRTIQANTTSLLMEAARFADEIKGKTKEDNGE